MKLGEAFVALGFDVDDDKLKAFQDKIDTLEGAMFKVSGVTAAALYGIDKFIDSVSRGAIALRDMSIQTGLNQQAIQQWALAAHVSDIALPFETASASIQTLQGNLAKLTMGGGNARPFSLLLNADARGMNAFEALQRLHEQLPEDLRKYGAAQVTSLMQEAGIDAHFLNLLEQTDDQFRKTMEGVRQFMPSDAQNKNLNAMAFALDQLHLKFDMFEKTLGAAFAPALIAGMEKIPHILQNIATAAEVLKTPLMIVGGLIGVAALALSPWIQLGIAIGAALLALEELGAYLKGEDNIFTDLAATIKWIGGLIQDNIVKPLKHVFEGRTDLDKTIQGYKKDGFHPDWDSVAQTLLSLNQTLMQMFAPKLDFGGGNQTANVNTTYHVHAPTVRDGLDATQDHAAKQYGMAYHWLNNGGQ